MAGRSAGWLPFAAVAVAAPFLAKPPVIDEESYLWLGTQAGWARPYDWSRLWPPFGDNGFVYAHPPFFLWWMKFWTAFGLPLWGTRLAAGLPWVALLAWSVARLAARTCRHPELAAGLWLSSSVVVLGLQDNLMIDLPFTALCTFAVACYREGLALEPSPYQSSSFIAPLPHNSLEQLQSPVFRWHLAAGVALGLAVETKYPALGLAAVLLWHNVQINGWRRIKAPLWGAAAAIVGAVEGLLLVEYGRPHLWEVWAHREEIAHGPFLGRLVGVLTRMSLLPLPLAVILQAPWKLQVSLGVGLLATVAVFRSLPGPGAGLFLFWLATLGCISIVRVVAALATHKHRRRKGDRGDALLLGGWGLVTVLGVVLLHNFASARYLLPAAAPLALLITRSGEELHGGKNVLRGSILASAILSAVLAVADYRFALASQLVAEEAWRAAQQPSHGYFVGEWGFRQTMEKVGWERLKAPSDPAAGSWVVVAENAGGGPPPPEGWEPMSRVEAPDRFPIKVVDTRAGVGLYAETLGPLPFGWSSNPLEAATVFQVKPQ